MLYLPAAARRTTQQMRRVGFTAGALGVALATATATSEVTGLGAHYGLYQLIIGCAAVSATLLGTAHVRTLIMQSAMGTMAELAKMTESQRRAADEMGALAAEMADAVITNRQMVAELARMRTALRDSDAGRKADADRHLDELTRLTEHVAEQVAEIRHLRTGLRERDKQLTELAAEYERILREDVPRAIRRAEARGYVAGFRQRLAERHRPDRGRTRPD